MIPIIYSWSNIILECIDDFAARSSSLISSLIRFTIFLLLLSSESDGINSMSRLDPDFPLIRSTTSSTLTFDGTGKLPRGTTENITIVSNTGLTTTFDLDLTKIKWERKFLSAFFGTIGYIKLPFPTLEFSKNKTNYYWAYF